jgi:hypothetical protein
MRRCRAAWKRNSFITKRATANAIAIIFLLAGSAVASAPSPDKEGEELCRDKGEGTHTDRWPLSGIIRLRVVCREGRNDSYVRYAWYFDENGRRIREEDLTPGKPEKSRIVLVSYDGPSTEPVGTRTYDGKGKLVSSTSARQEASAARSKKPEDIRAAYHDYIETCEENPNAMLHSFLGKVKDPQFFTKAACACVAEKAVRLDDAPPGKIWKSMRTLDRSRILDRLTVAAVQNLNECLCPEAFPESELSKTCLHAADVEKAWTPE